MKIEITQKPSDYENFLINNSSSFYQSSKHLSFLENILEIPPKFITVRESMDIVGVLPIFYKKTKLGIVINSLPFFGSYGGVISQKNEVKKIILKFLNDHLKELDILSTVIISNPFEKTETYEKYFEYTEKVQRISQCIKIQNKKSEEIWNNFEQRVRRGIRKAEKNSIVTEYSEPTKNILHDFYKNHVKNISSKNGAIKPKKFFECVKNNFEVSEDYDILTAKYNEKTIANLLVFYSKPYTEYYMPAYDIENSHLQGTSLLIWESIKKSISRNMKYYNFGGTHKKHDSLYNFKKGWNTEDFIYNYYINADLDRLSSIDLDELKQEFDFFYVYNYNKILN